MKNIIVKILLKKIPGFNSLECKICRFKWRKLNSHNYTTMGNVFDKNNVSVGRATYGTLKVLQFEHGSEELIIGNFCSIAPEVVFMLDGQHDYSRITTYPLKRRFLGEQESISKGNILIGDDVWIGYRAIILSGITIGQGAVVGAGAIVTRDVPPYAIVAGIPARVVKYRFSESIRERLLDNINFGNVDKDRVIKNMDNCYEPLETENGLINNELIDSLIEIFNTESGVGVNEL